MKNSKEIIKKIEELRKDVFSGKVVLTSNGIDHLLWGLRKWIELDSFDNADFDYKLFYEHINDLDPLITHEAIRKVNKDTRLKRLSKVQNDPKGPGFFNGDVSLMEDDA